jgi:hypothetical protein
MKKSITIGIVALVLVSSYAAVVFAHNTQNIQTKNDACSFSSLQLNEQNDGTQVTLPEATSYISTPGGYQLPVVTRVFTFPFTTKITDVTVSYSDTTEQVLSKPVLRTPQPIADTNQQTTQATTVGTWTVYPEQPFSYHVAAGTDGTNQVNFLAVQLYPVSYNVAEQKLSQSKNAQITIQYILPSSVPTSAEQYDLLILAPKEFASALQPLVDHKISKGVATKLVTREEVCDGTYFPAEGRDCGEEHKYFIKNAFDSWGIDYVLFVGGRKGGINQETWWIPIRYSSLDDGAEGSYLTDLYFADLYDANGSFSSWDSNNNGKFGEWTYTSKDILDMYPEIGVGRLACINVKEVKLVVQRIITYENTAYGSDWFKRFVGVAGDTYPEENDYYEGEMATNASYAQIQSMGFDASFMWTSNNQFTGKKSILDEISKGCGFVHFSGHGNPAVWSNHKPHNDSFLDGPSAFDMRKLTNKDQLPIVIVGGCHNQQFNTSLTNIIKGVIQDGLQYFSAKRPVGAFWYNEWIPRCWGWAMASAPKGGCIAVMANSGYGYGQPGSETLTQLGRHLEWLFFKSYADGNDHLGMTHAQELVYYMNAHPPMADSVDCKIVQQWVLLGDPSLQIGGYST